MMRTNKSNSFNKSFKKGLQSKSTTLKTQEKTIFNYLQRHTATNTMVSYATGIAQKNICRAKRNLEKAGLLQETEQKLCKITGHRAWYLTTNKNLFNKE
ncbi:hypothetical protein [uncultured Polaribacter sp.]|uniref:hypothetical protein n=1 Tax=uncultured Polaribacter sp. TaxID=174711 RepID=UPI00260BDE89|nr:hypothetical protein [uncultured Polaribacter sp.]